MKDIVGVFGGGVGGRYKDWQPTPGGYSDPAWPKVDCHGEVMLI